jgi:Ser/Thr protein kinase RdoA (MazF antagonist)
MPLERSLFTQEELISFVRACYGLKITSVRRLPLGSANCFCLMCETKRYFLKEFQSGITPQSVAAEAALLEILARRGIPVARTLPGLDGAFVTVYGGHAVCLQEFVEGQTYGYDDFPDHLLPSLAHTLGRLHTAMRDIGMPSPRDANIAASYRAADSAVQYEQLLMDAERIREDPEYARIVEELKYKRELAYRAIAIGNITRELPIAPRTAIFRAVKRCGRESACALSLISPPRAFCPPCGRSCAPMCNLPRNVALLL